MGLLAEAAAGDIRSLARILTLVENRDPIGLTALDRLYPSSGVAHRIGVTGPPGAGKSSLIDHLIRSYRAHDRKVAVVAVDPSSRSSGGATLGDRIRLLGHHADPGVYVRSLASRGQRGGLSAATMDVAHVLDAVGFDPILIESMGVGQDEIDISRIVDTTVLVQVPGLGDTVQTLKSGIMEIGDIIAVNKADRPGVGALVRDLQRMIALGHPPVHGSDAWLPVVIPVSATTGDGISQLVDSLSKHSTFLEQSDQLSLRRKNAALAEVEFLIRAELERRLAYEPNTDFTQMIEAIALRRVSPRAALVQARIQN